MNGGALGGEAPGDKSAAVDRVLEPGIEFAGHIAIQENLDGLFQFTGEFANLQIAHVCGGLPIDVAGTLEGFIGADAIEVAAETAIVGFDFAGDAGEKVVEARLGIDGGVDHHFAGKGDAGGFFQEAEGEGSGEGEAVLAVSAAAREADIDAGI